MRTLVVKLSRPQYWGLWPSDVPLVPFDGEKRPCAADCPYTIKHTHWWNPSILERRSFGWRPVSRVVETGPGRSTQFTRE